MAGYATGMQSSYGQASPVMRNIQGLNNFNQQFGGRAVNGMGKQSQAKQPQVGGSQKAPMLSNAWFGNMLGQAQRYLRGI